MHSTSAGCGQDVNGCIKPVPPLIAAYQAGRLIAQFGFFAQQAWLGITNQSKAVAEVFGKLLAVTEAIPSASASDNFLKKSLRDRYDDWEDMLNSEWLAEGFFDVNRTLRDLWERSDFDVVQLKECRSFVAPVIDLTEKISEAIKSCLDDHARKVFDIGRSLQAALCPENIHRFLFETTAEQPPMAWDPATSRQPTDDAPPRNLLANRSRQPGEIRPSTACLSEVRHHLLDIGTLDELIQLENANTPQTRVETVGRLATIIERTLLKQSGILEKTTDEVCKKTGYLGLIIYPDSYEVGREGMPNRVNLGGLLPTQIVLLVATRQEARTTLNDLGGVWQKYGRDQAPQDNTIRTQMSKISGSLRSLGVRLRAKRGEGWRFECDSS